MTVTSSSDRVLGERDRERWQADLEAIADAALVAATAIRAEAEQPVVVTVDPADAGRPPKPAPGGARAKAPLSVRRTIGTSLIAFAAFVFAFAGFLVGPSALQQGRDQDGLESRFRTDLANATAPVGGTISAGTPVAIIDIPSIHVRQIVVEGTDGAQLKKGPGHLRSSPLPGQAGGSVIAAHRIAYGGPFSRIDDLDKGAKIVTTTGQGEATYVIDSVTRVKADDPSPFTASGNTLTLLSSAPYFVASERWVAVAHLEGTPKPAPSGRPAAIDDDEQALQATTAHLAELALWALLLAAAATGTVLLYRRWHTIPAYLITTPPLLAATWLLFENLSLLLPSTL